jgi:hypothetical protein
VHTPSVDRVRRCRELLFSVPYTTGGTKENLEPWFYPFVRRLSIDFRSCIAGPASVVVFMPEPGGALPHN